MKIITMEEFFRTYTKDESNLWRNKEDGFLYEAEFDYGKAMLRRVKE